MEKEPAPPLVTISDPHHPGTPVDVVGAEERPPLSRRTRLGLVLVVLLAAGTAGTTAAVRAHQREQAADRASLAALALEPFDSGGGSRFLFHNPGPGDLTVLSARVDREGYATTPYRVRLIAGATSTLMLPFAGPCPTQVPVNGPSTVVFRVRDGRGHERDLRVDIRGREVSQAFLEQVQQFCRLFPPGQALVPDSVSTSLTGRVLTVTTTAHNRGVLPLTLEGVLPRDDLTVQPLQPFPVVLPGTPQGGAPTPVTLRLRLTVRSCAALLATRVGSGDGDPGFGLALRVGEDVVLVGGTEGLSRDVARLDELVCGRRRVTTVLD